MGAAHVEQHRQLEFLGQRQLRFEQSLLAFLVGAFDVVVQADLADGAELLRAPQPLQPVAQNLEVRGSMVLEKHRMQSQRRMDLRFVARQLPDTLPVGFVHAEHDDALHAGCAAAGQHLMAIRVEGLEIQVGMGVDQRHVGSFSFGKGDSVLRSWRLVSAVLPLSGYR